MKHGKSYYAVFMFVFVIIALFVAALIVLPPCPKDKDVVTIMSVTPDSPAAITDKPQTQTNNGNNDNQSTRVVFRIGYQGSKDK